ncbi:hypothetical protein EDC39_11269 [Geothermobacter ehrlichii]|uniref:Uncharacterized protein n=1 Tax=Geothermobacter ehrlichii TaxID=213224 RepID=A0A5D3WIJ8_9BACT|nr:hypothetical protein [Geothermobacter ehrlichii]TYO96781.1 hypothetical protein EDC39_11269 [Geothermobacter ehrlichii]
MSGDHQDRTTHPHFTSMEAGPAPASFSPLPRAMGPVQVFFLCLLTSLATAVGTVWYYDQHYAQKIVAVDLKGFLQQQKDDYLNGRISEDDLNRRMNELEAFVDRIPENHSVILGDVVVRNIEVLKP